MAEQTVKVRKSLSANAKKVIVLCSMVALLVLTGVLNFVLNGDLLSNDDQTPVDGGAVTTFFSNYRTDRETARAEEMSYLDAIISSEDSSAEAKATAEEMKQELLANIETELVIENLIKAKGFEDAIVTMSTDNVNVIIQKAELESTEVAQILGIILEETDYTASDVVVVPYEA
ncbi:MAG TPA: SpoIIIAH-like family protein [Candidatus Ornithoclostridium excrementipullorum]|nr:SpoIIIAH-like family protein [Candidatus Ornithoclostridium excrementipullorum]